MEELYFDKLGNFTEKDCKNIKKMMNPLNWGTEEIKEATASALLFGAGLLTASLIIWLAY